MPLVRRASSLYWPNAPRCGCIICGPFVAQRRQANLTRIRRVAASLPGFELVLREAAVTEKARDPRSANSGGLYRSPRLHTEVRAASAQSDTRN